MKNNKSFSTAVENYTNFVEKELYGDVCHFLDLTIPFKKVDLVNKPNFACVLFEGFTKYFNDEEAMVGRTPITAFVKAVKEHTINYADCVGGKIVVGFDTAFTGEVEVEVNFNEFTDADRKAFIAGVKKLLAMAQ